jgi:hypothetical protein
LINDSNLNDNNNLINDSNLNDNNNLINDSNLNDNNLINNLNNNNNNNNNINIKEEIILKKELKIKFKNLIKKNKLKNIIKHSYLIIKDKEEIIIKSFKEYKKKNYMYSIQLILPQIEHHLRRIYVSSNEEIIEDLYLAQSNILFSIFDDILSFFINKNKINNLILKIGLNPYYFLSDFFLHNEGYKIRGNFFIIIIFFNKY